jgi:hypothetical protein
MLNRGLNSWLKQRLSQLHLEANPTMGSIHAPFEDLVEGWGKAYAGLPHQGATKGE